MGGGRQAGWPILLLAVVLVGVPAGAQQAGATVAVAGTNLENPPSSLQPDAVVPAAPDTYAVGAEDVLGVFVYQMPDLTCQVRVDKQGRVRLPFLQRQIQVAGQTSPEIEATIAGVLVSAGLARAPQVRVVVRQVSSRLLVVGGAVQRPSVLAIDHPISVLEAIARGGGLADSAGDRVRIIQHGADGADQAREIALQPILSGVTPGPQLEGNETLDVELAQLVYVMGSVNKAGAFALRPGQPLTIASALAMAGGVQNPADRKHLRLIHPAQGAAPPTQTMVDLNQILEHRAPEVSLRAGDILYVPESGRSKVLTMAMNSIAQAAVIAIGYNAASIF